MPVALTAVQWAAIVNSVIGLAAFGLATFSVWHQRRQPFLDAQCIGDVGSGAAGVVIYNNGTRTARAPWVMFNRSDGSFSFCSHVGPGFLGAGEGRYVLTTAAPPGSDDSSRALGVVGYIDSRGRHVVRPFEGGRARKFPSGRWWKRPKPSFLEIYESFHGEVELGPQAGTRSDKPLSGM
jgi:hypothetical protein